VQGRERPGLASNGNRKRASGGSRDGVFDLAGPLVVIASAATQSIVTKKAWIASSLRASQ
jgi:hypothetical protein